jgi:hypothetical protein
MLTACHRNIANILGDNTTGSPSGERPIGLPVGPDDVSGEQRLGEPPLFEWYHRSLLAVTSPGELLVRLVIDGKHNVDRNRLGKSIVVASLSALLKRCRQAPDWQASTKEPSDLTLRSRAKAKLSGPERALSDPAAVDAVQVNVRTSAVISSCTSPRYRGTMTPAEASARLPGGMRSSFLTLVRQASRGSREALHFRTILRSAASTIRDAGPCKEGGMLSCGVEGGHGGVE